MKLVRILAVAAFLLISAFAIAQTTQPVEQANIDKLVNLLQANGYAYHTTRSPSVFTVHFVGQHIKDIKVVITVSSGSNADVVVFVTVTEKRRMPVTTDFMRLLLRNNHIMDETKIGFDKDDDLEVRIDDSMRLIDAAYFRHVVEQVKDVSDDLYGQIEPSLSN